MPPHSISQVRCILGEIGSGLAVWHQEKRHASLTRAATLPLYFPRPPKKTSCLTLHCLQCPQASNMPLSDPCSSSVDTITLAPITRIGNDGDQHGVQQGGVGPKLQREHHTHRHDPKEHCRNGRAGRQTQTQRERATRGKTERDPRRNPGPGDAHFRLI